MPPYSEQISVPFLLCLHKHHRPKYYIIIYIIILAIFFNKKRHVPGPSPRPSSQSFRFSVLHIISCKKNHFWDYLLTLWLCFQKLFLWPQTKALWVYKNFRYLNLKKKTLTHIHTPAVVILIAPKKLK